MTNLCSANSLYIYNAVLKGAAAILCGDYFKFCLNMGVKLGVIPPRAEAVRGAVCDLWTTTKDFFKWIEPYQPLAATLTILSKAAWKTKTTAQFARDIKKKKNKLTMLTNLQKATQRDCSHKIAELKQDIQRKKDESLQSFFAIGQLGSLWYPHPGSNVWNSVNTLSARFFSMRRLNLRKAPLATVLGLISAAGTAASFLKQTGMTGGQSPFHHVILGASFVGMALETGLMFKNWLLPH